MEPVEFGDLYKEASQVQVGDDGTKLEDIEDIEDAYEYYNDINKLYPYGVVPYNFLCEQGLMTKDAEGKYRLNSDSAYCESTILVDHNSSENDVYLFLNYSDKSEECDFTSTWKLKYVLEGNDYNDLLYLGSEIDVRTQAFVEAMDEKYTPEIMAHSIIQESYANRAKSWFNVRASECFVIVDSIDRETGDVTLRVLSKYKTYAREDVYSFNLKKCERWESKIQAGFTEQDLLNANFTEFLTELGVGYMFPAYETDVMGYDPIHGVDTTEFATGESINTITLLGKCENVAEYQVMEAPIAGDKAWSNGGNLTKSKDASSKYEKEREKYLGYYPSPEYTIGK